MPHKGGIEYVVYSLSKEFVKLGNEVTVISSLIGTDIKEEIMNGIKIKRVRAFPILKSPFSFSLFFRLMKEKPDVIHLHHPHPFFLETGILYAKVFRIPIVLHCHGMEITMRGLFNIFAQIYNNTLLKIDMAMADRLIMHTNRLFESSKLAKKYTAKVKVLKCGVDLIRYSGKRKTDLKKELGFENNKIILFVGQLRQYKRVDILIKAFNDVIKNMPDVRIIIVGNGDKENELKDLAKRLEMQEKIVFAGFVDDDKKLDYYSIADVFVLPSPNLEEGFGLVALEAAAMEVPVIVTEGAGISEAFKEDNIGILIEPYSIEAMKNAIIDVLKNKKKARLCAKKLKDVVDKKYAWDKLAIEYLKLYKEVMPDSKF